MSDATRAAGNPSPCQEQQLTASEEEQLLGRPSISIRVRIAGVFFLLFVLMCGFTVAAVVLLSELRVKQGFLDTASSYAFEIQQARRYEKNFFLYGTDLSDAVASIHTAHHYLDREAEQMESVLGKETLKRTKESLRSYQLLLEQMLADPGPAAGDAERRRVETRLRKNGAQILADAQEMIDHERMAMHSLLHTSTLAAIAFLVFMLFIMAYVAGLITRSVLGPLGRFMSYASRIGAGDYSPITPARKYRDEFSNLAMAFNRMLCELKDRQEQLLQSRKMAAVGTLTSGIAHELNNPLNNIGLTTEALIEGFEDYGEADKRRMLEQIYTQVERASSTVRNLLDFTRKDQPALGRVSMRQVLDASARLVANELSLGRVELDLEVADELPPISGNARNLQQVFVNLFLNAVQAMPQGGKLTVRCAPENGSVRVDVSDTGVGIPPEDLGEIFDPFFTTKDPGEGTGLGLSVSYGIIQKHNGRINVHSQVGVGTTFTVLLPYEERRTTSVGESSTESA